MPTSFGYLEESSYTDNLSSKSCLPMKISCLRVKSGNETLVKRDVG